MKFNLYNSVDLSYEIGEPFFGNLNQQEYRYMLHIVAYDITDPSRLRKVAKICESFGVRVEKSVFESDLPEESFNLFWETLRKTIDLEDDTLLAYRIGQCCLKKSLSLGQYTKPIKALYYIF